MYHHSFLFVVISNNKRIEEALNVIEPLEDCDYSFTTVGSAKDAPVGSSKPDIAFIYDSIGGVECSLEKGAHEECILVADGANPMLADETAVAAVSGIWVMPRQGEYDDGLLKAYFGRLARRMKKSADDRKYVICFDTLVNSVPDISWFKDVDGAHLIVNDSFCEMVGKTKEQIYKKGHCFIWDATKEDEEVCLTSDRIIMDSRKTNEFEEAIKTKKDTRLLKSYKSALIDTDGNIFGTCGIAHDVTELRNMGTEMDIVLDSVPFAVLMETMDGKVIKKNARFDDYFPEFNNIVGKSSREWKDSLNRKLLLEDSLMEVIVQSGTENRVLVFEEEPIQDTFGTTVAKIVTLTDITLEWGISKQNEHTANTDYLTGLSNRRNLMSYLSGMYTMDDASLVMVDLDNFKYVNDTYGHDAGDQALIKTAAILNESFRDGFVARLGGDEFMIVVEGKDEDEIRQQTEQMLERMRSEYGRQEEFKDIAASAGIVSVKSIPESKRSVSELLKLVDAMLYEAKNSGKNRCCVYGG